MKTINAKKCLLPAVLLVVISLGSPHALAQESLTPEQQALFDALQAETGPQASLREAIEAYQSNHETFLASYEYGQRLVAMEGIPSDGQTHTIKVAHDVFVLREDEQVFRYREVLTCDAKGSETGIPTLDCSDN